MDDVVSFIREKANTMFDPALVDLLLDNIDDFLEIKRRYKDSH
jgi:response regulator RpfG family c-di-GMP phosphodiesterase